VTARDGGIVTGTLVNICTKNNELGSAAAGNKHVAAGHWPNLRAAGACKSGARETAQRRGACPNDSRRAPTMRIT